MLAKNIIKAVVPTYLLRGAIDAYERVKLSTVPRCDFDSSALRQSDSIGLREIFSHPEDSRAADELITLLWGDVPGAAGRTDRRAIYHLIRSLNPLHVLEIGTWVGSTSAYIAAALRANGKGFLTTVDVMDVNADTAPWRNLGLQASPAFLALQLGLDNRMAFRQSDSLRFMRTTEKRFDFIFLDGDHSAPMVYLEIAAALRILEPNGVILLHDFYPHRRPLAAGNTVIAGPFMAMQRIKAEGQNIEVLPIGTSAFAISSLAILARR